MGRGSVELVAVGVQSVIMLLITTRFLKCVLFNVDHRRTMESRVSAMHSSSGIEQPSATLR